MSTPQDHPQGTGDGRHGTQGNGQAGEPPTPYQQDGSGRYGYQGAQPSGYAYPTSGGDVGPADKGPAPKEVQRAYSLILAAGVVYLLSAILSAVTTEVPGMAGVSLAIGLVFAVVFTAVYVVLAIFIRRGQNWARITATVLAALNVLSVLGSLLLLPLASRAAEASGQTIPEASGLATTLGVIVMLLGVAGVSLTYLRPARPYFAPRKLGY